MINERQCEGDAWLLWALLLFQQHRCVLTCDGGYGGAFAGDQSHYLWFGDQASAGEDVVGVRYQSAAHPYGFPQSGLQM